MSRDAERESSPLVSDRRNYHLSRQDVERVQLEATSISSYLVVEYFCNKQLQATGDRRSCQLCSNKKLPHSNSWRQALFPLAHHANIVMLCLERGLLHFYFCIVNVYQMWILHLLLSPAAVCISCFSVAGTNHEHTANRGKLIWSCRRTRLYGGRVEA